MDYKDHFDRKQQYFEKTKEITNEKNQLEILGEQKRKNVIDLEKKKLDLEKQMVDAKTSKDKNDAIRQTAGQISKNACIKCQLLFAWKTRVFRIIIKVILLD